MMKHFDSDLPALLRGESDAAELEEIWTTLGEVRAVPLPVEETDRAWEEVAARTGISAVEPDAEDAPASRRRGGVRVLLRVAAVAVVALGGVAAWYSVPVTRTAQAAEQQSLLLPDGSTVELNAGSSLRYRRSFSLLPGLASPTRSVRLQGEAFFSVVPGVRPFRVEAGPAQVRVLGTRFNVRARGDDEGEAARVEVEEGRVEVWSRGGSSSLILRAGEAARVAGSVDVPTRETLAPERVGAWRHGGLTVVDEPLSSILRELSLRYGVRIRLADPQAGVNRLSVFYPELASLESALADLATQQNLRYRRTSDGWELF